MQSESVKVGGMKNRRVVMADGRRHLIYYTFEKSESSLALNKLKEATAENEATEKKEVSENV